MMLNFGSKLIKLRETKETYTHNVKHTTVFSRKYYITPSEKSTFHAKFPTNAIFQPDCCNDNEIHLSIFCTIRGAQQNDSK